MRDLKKGIHSLKVLKDRIIVESNFGRTSMRSTYSLEEYSKALECFKRLTDSE